MNILIITENFFPEVNASARRIYERAVYWVKLGCHVTVVTGAPNAPRGKIYEGYKNRWHQIEYIEGIKVVRTKSFIAGRKKFMARLLNYLSLMVMSFFTALFEKNHDVILVNSPQFFILISGWLLAKIQRQPLVFEIADLWPASVVAFNLIRQNLLVRTIERMELFLYRQADAIIALTKYIKSDMVRRGIVEEKISVIRNGVDEYGPLMRDAKLAESLDLQHKFVIGYLGNHGHANALENVVAAAAYLKKNEAIHFLFVGDGVGRNALIDLAKQKQLDNITFIPLQKRDRINDYWSLCNVGLVHLKNHPLFSGALPLKLYKALAMHLPIILAAPRGEASDLIEEVGVGVWVEPESPIALANTVLSLYENRHCIKQFSENAQAAAPHYTRKKQALQVFEVISQAVNMY